MMIRLAILTALMALAPAVSAGPIVDTTWYEFGFTDAGVGATGCDPADPSGPFCIASSGTPTVFLDAPAWTFSVLSSAALTVTDAFESGDQFEVLDFGIPIGFTSLPAGGVDCGDDPVVCLGTAGMSVRTFVLAAGLHAITIAPLLSPSGGGAAYLRFIAVPEPGTIVLVILGLALVGLYTLRIPRK